MRVMFITQPVNASCTKDYLTPATRCPTEGEKKLPIGMIKHEVLSYVDFVMNQSIAFKDMALREHELGSFLDDFVLILTDKNGGSIVVLKSVYWVGAHANMKMTLYGCEVHTKVR